MAQRKKTGGRQKGTPNRSTAEIKELLNQIISNNLDNINQWIKKVSKDDPAKALELLLKVAPFVLPKATSNIDITTKGKSVNGDVYNKLSMETKSRIASELYGIDPELYRE